MISTQRLIKYLAMGFAAYLIFNILFGIMFGLSMVSKVFNNETEDKNTSLEELVNLETDLDNIEFLNIDVSSANLIIKSADDFKIETNNKYIEVTKNDNKLIIKEKKHNLLKKYNRDLIIYIPVDNVFDEIIFNTGAGKVEIENLNTKVLDFDFGAGQVIINNLIASKKAEIEGGAGEIKILNGSINNLDLNVGVGEFTLNSKLKGSSYINAGVGELNINLLGNKEDYKINVEKGIGSAKINGKNIKSNQIYGKGKNSIDIDGGIGSININFR